jgi:hypothetical protein
VHRAFALVFLAGIAPAAAQEGAPAPEGAASGIAPAEPPPTVGTPVAALDCSALLAGAPNPSSALARLAAERLERLGAFEPGPLGDYLISELAKQVCAAPEVAATLTTTCGPPSAVDVRELRRRLIGDAGRTIAAQAESVARSAGLTPASTEALLLGTVLQALFDTPSARSLAWRLLQAAPGALQRDCSISGSSVDAYRELRTAAVLLWQLEQEAEKLSEAELQALALRILAASGKQAENGILSPLQQSALGALREDLARAKAATGQNLDAAGYAALAGVYANALAHALSLAQDRSVLAPAAAVAITTALVQGDLQQAFEQASASVVGASGGQAVKSLLFGMRVARARSEEEAKAMLARAVLGLGPWSDHWVVGLNLGVPRLDFDNLKVAGDAKLGYNGQRFGVVAKGYLSYYDLTSDVLLTDNFLAGGSADVWLTFNPEAQLKWELRGDLGLSVYDTSSFPIGQAEGDVVSDENSFMLRGSALLGMRAEFPKAALGLWLGGGSENEQYDELTVDQALDTHIKDHTDWHLMLTGRLRAQFPIVSNILVGRVRGDFLRHSITRDSLSLDIGDRLSTSSVASASVQLEVGGRAYVDLEIAKFFGFVPAVEGGVDYFSLADSAGEVTTTVPIVGIGIRRTEF